MSEETKKTEANTTAPSTSKESNDDVTKKQSEQIAKLQAENKVIKDYIGKKTNLKTLARNSKRSSTSSGITGLQSLKGFRTK